MNPLSPSQVKDWCISNAFHPNRTLGQNFLIDRNVREAIIDAAGVDAGKRVLEVGPGLGVLTEGMLERGANVFAIEKDTRLAERLQREWKNDLLEARLETPTVETGELTVVAQDALKTNWDELFAAPFDAFVSNLPYSVGTRILMDVALHPAAPKSLTVLVQTEVAQRFAAAPGDDARGQAGVWLQLDWEVKVLFSVAGTCFWPRPEVESSVVRLDYRGGGLNAEERKSFLALSKLCFMHRRKQIGTILRKAPGFEGYLQALEAAGVEATARPETLSAEQWKTMAKTLAAGSKKSFQIGK